MAIHVKLPIMSAGPTCKRSSQLSLWVAGVPSWMMGEGRVTGFSPEFMVNSVQDEKARRGGSIYVAMETLQCNALGGSPTPLPVTSHPCSLQISLIKSKFPRGDFDGVQLCFVFETSEKEG